MHSVANITRRLTQLSVRSTPTFISASKSKPNHPSLATAIRTFSSKEGESSSTSTSTESSTKQWEDVWQKSFATSDASVGKALKKRGGKAQRKKEAAKSLSSQERLIDAGPGQFPPLRFSDEETERLLKQAYASIPERAGKRGTRSFKRQKNKFHWIRKARAIKKKEKIDHHFDRMEKRSQVIEGVKRMKEAGKEIRVKDKEYQMTVLKKWAEINGVALAGTAEGGGEEEVHV